MFLAAQATAAPYRFTPFDAPGVNQACSPFECQYAVGINDEGTIVGAYFDADHLLVGFLRDSAGSFTVIDHAGVVGINDTGHVVGNLPYSIDLRRTGFLREASGLSTPIQFPGAWSTSIIGINDAGQILGTYASDGRSRAFLREPTGDFTTLDFSGLGLNLVENGLYSENTLVLLTGLNDRGEIVGDVVGSGVGGTFVRDSTGAFTMLDEILNLSTTGINDSGQIIGIVNEDGVRGFVRDSDGRQTVFEVPGASRTEPRGINDAGQIVGYFQDEFGYHGFLATPVPVPPALPLFGAALSLVMTRRRR